MTDTNTHTPQNNLRELRRDALLSQEELAALVGITGQAIGLIEAGKRAGLWKTRKKIARALGVAESVIWPSGGATRAERPTR